MFHTGSVAIIVMLCYMMMIAVWCMLDGIS